MFEQKASQAIAEPFTESVVQLLESSQAVGQFPSQVSFVSITPFPQLGAQSLSLLLLHPLGQKPQAALQFEELPLRESEVQTSPSSQAVGQLPSQVSPASTTLLEQIGAQSLSLRLLQPGAQQPSAEVQAEIGVLEHSALQVVEEPIKTSLVQAFWSSQLVGQSPSQLSPASSNKFPQTDWQSLSKRESHPLGQHPSSSVQDRIRVLKH